MLRHLLQRSLDLLIVLFGISVIVFLMIRLIPGDAVAIMLGANTEVTPERIAQEALSLYRGEPRRQTVCARLTEACRRLGPPGAAARVAE